MKSILSFISPFFILPPSLLPPSPIFLTAPSLSFVFHCSFPLSLGHKMSEMPLEPQLAKMLLISPEFNCSNEVSQRPLYSIRHPVILCRSITLPSFSVDPSLSHHCLSLDLRLCVPDSSPPFSTPRRCCLSWPCSPLPPYSCGRGRPPKLQTRPRLSSRT